MKTPEDIKVNVKLKLATLWASLRFLIIYLNYFLLYSLYKKTQNYCIILVSETVIFKRKILKFKNLERFSFEVKEKKAASFLAGINYYLKKVLQT